MKCPWPIGERISFLLPDGATLTYDMYKPLDTHASEGNFIYKHLGFNSLTFFLKLISEDVTLVMCPGICNSSESIYIRTFVHHAQRKGYRCTVLNHIGALKDIKLTSHRIFSYGCTRDLHEMVTHVVDRYPQTKVVTVGFSMGGNIVTKYLGEKPHQVPKNIIGGISICQGYDALR